jgi:hypothetical protein
MQWKTSDSEKFAILSEDETAYGNEGVYEDPKQDHSAPCAKLGIELYYPRDISALRGAYQTKSIFDLPSGSRSPDPQRSLPSDLADPAGKVHDSIRSYGGNQTPLEQEATLLEIVAALRDLHARTSCSASATLRQRNLPPCGPASYDPSRDKRRESPHERI